MNLKIRIKIILLTVVILFFAIGTTTLINSRLFVREYSGALKSKLVFAGEALKSQLDKLLALGIPLEELIGFEEQCQELIKQHSEISYAMVVDKNGKILFHNDPSQHNKNLTDPMVLETIHHQKKVIQLFSEHKKEYYEIILPVLNLHEKHIASVRVGFPVKIVTQKTKNMITYSMEVAFVSLSLAIFLLVFGLSVWVTRPLSKLIIVIQEIRKKGTDFSRRVEVDSKDEIGALASSFNKMIEDLHQTTVSKEVLRESEDRYRDLVEFSEYLICTHNLEGKILSINQRATKLLGYEQRDIINKNIRDFLAPEVRGEFDHYLNTILKEGSSRGMMLVQTASGEKRVWEYNNSLRTEGVTEPIVRSMAHDITDLKRIEKEREKLILQLQKALAEVKQLSGLLPICSSCKKIRDDKGYWNQIETYIHEHSEAEFSHGICPECFKKLYPDF